MYEMVVDSSGFFYLAGDTWSYGNGSSDIFIVKMNENFSQYNTWGGVESEEFSGMVIDKNDNIYVAGRTLSYGAGDKDVVLLKYNKSLILEWSCTWGDNGSDSCSGIEIDSLNNVYIAGMTNSPYYDIFLAKYNSTGSLQWNHTWSTKTQNITEEVLSLVIDSSDHIFLGVNTNYTGSEWVLLKYNSSGTLLLNNSLNMYLPLQLLTLDSSDNLYAAGSFNDMSLAKFDNNGNLDWNLTCIKNIVPGTEVLEIDPFDDIVVTGNELINASAILYGYNITDYDTYLMKFNSSGSLKWNHTMRGGNNIYPEFLAFDSLGYIFLVGSFEYIATKDLSLSIDVFNINGIPRRGLGGGDIEYCKGIFVESLDSFITAGNGHEYIYPTGYRTDYDIILINWIESEDMCPYGPQYWWWGYYQTLSIIFNSIFYTFCIIGIIYLIKRRKNRLKQ
ncbi:MAG: SBBP repeat-containing protein [Promethearchaeota archaeon]